MPRIVEMSFVSRDGGIDAHSLKIQGEREGPCGFCQILGGMVYGIGVVSIFGGGYTFLGFYYIFVNKF